MATPTYYIEVDTYWQNSKSYFVGPFISRKKAVAWYNTDNWKPEHNVWLSTSLCGGNIKEAWRIYEVPICKTKARKEGMRAYYLGDYYHNVIDPSTQPTAASLSNEVDWLYELASK